MEDWETAMMVGAEGGGAGNGKMWILVKFHVKFYISIATALIYIERVKVCFLPIVTLSNFDQSIRHFGINYTSVRHYGIRHYGIRHSGNHPIVVLYYYNTDKCTDKHEA